MSSFVTSAHCVDRHKKPHHVHCRICRDSEQWRAEMGAPTICPYGITADSIPQRAQIPMAIPPPGAGTELKRLLRSLGITPTPSCACNAMAARMDANGQGWCAQHMEEIVAVMTEEASKRGWMKLVPFKELGAAMLVRRAIAAARQNSLSTSAPSTP